MPQRPREPQNMPIAVLATAVAIIVGFAASACADDRPSDPFGSRTVELNSDAPLFQIWEFLKNVVLLDKVQAQRCLESSDIPCPGVSTLVKIVDEARQNHG